MEIMEDFFKQSTIALVYERQGERWSAPGDEGVWKKVGGERTRPNLK
jgi:hypothetical protein